MDSVNYCFSYRPSDHDVAPDYTPIDLLFNRMLLGNPLKVSPECLPGEQPLLLRHT